MHRAVDPGAAFFVAATVKRGNGAGDDFAGFFENDAGGVFIHHVGQRRQLRPEPGNLKHFIEYETHIAQGCFVVSHDEIARLEIGQCTFRIRKCPYRSEA
ncbi:hypothetical protein D3C78_1676350 [compost metagenome]